MLGVDFSSMLLMSWLMNGVQDLQHVNIGTKGGRFEQTLQSCLLL